MVRVLIMAFHVNVPQPILFAVSPSLSPPSVCYPSAWLFSIRPLGAKRGLTSNHVAVRTTPLFRNAEEAQPSIVAFSGTMNSLPVGLQQLHELISTMSMTSDHPGNPPSSPPLTK